VALVTTAGRSLVLSFSRLSGMSSERLNERTTERKADEQINKRTKRSQMSG